MSTKKRHGKVERPKQAMVDTPLDRLNEKETLVHYNAVLMEDIKSKIDLMIEGAGAMRTEFDQKIEALRTEMNRRFSMLEKALHSLKEDIVELDHRMSSKISNLSDRCNTFDRRFTSIQAGE